MSDAFKSGRAFIHQHARELEQALFGFHFNAGGVDEVLSALKPYQNEDGGFGHGLEPDCNDDQSSVLDTTIALQLLRELGRDAGCGMVQKAIGYLKDTFDESRRIWPIRQVVDAQRECAPWWKADSVDELIKNFHGCLLNPRAEVVAHLLHYRELVDESWLNGLVDEVVELICSHEERLEHHDFLCAVRLLECDTLNEALHARLKPAMISQSQRVIELDPEKWNGYCVKPLDIISHPEHDLVEAVGQEIIRKHCDYELSKQTEDGGWYPAWTWEELHPEAWAKAKMDWAGVLTLKTLRVLRHWDAL